MIVKDILCIGVNGMISNQILQNTVEGLKQISRVELGIIDTEGNVLAATFPEAGDFSEPARIFANSPADSQEVQGYQFFKVYDETQLEYILLASGSLSRICYWITCC